MSSSSTSLLLKSGLISLGLIMIYSCSKQPGCIDPNATNYEYEAKKNDGTCLYDMSFWLNTRQHGEVDIFVDGVYKDYLNCYWISSEPTCGVDTANSGARHCTSNIALRPGKHQVRIVGEDGTVWEKEYTLPENCMKILVTAVN